MLADFVDKIDSNDSNERMIRMVAISSNQRYVIDHHISRTFLSHLDHRYQVSQKKVPTFENSEHQEC